MEEQKNTEQKSTEQHSAPKPAHKNIEEHKAMAIIGYILPFLFFVPLLSEARNVPFAKFHANQQLNLFLFWLIGQAAAAILAIILVGFLIGVIVWVMGIIFLIMGIINAANGEMKPLPLIGGFSLIK